VAGDGDGGTALSGDALADELRRTRDEAARRRIEARDATAAAKQATDVLGAIKTALGLGPTADPEATVKDLQRQLASERLTNAAYRQARREGADPDLVVPYLVGAGILTEIDPAASTEARDADLSARIKKALHDYPALRGTPPPPTSGGAPPTGGTKAPTFSRAQIAQMTPAEIEKHQAAIDEWLRAGAPEA